MNAWENAPRRLIALCAVLATLVLGACGTLPHRAVPEPLADAAEVPGFPGLRFWGDAAPAGIEAEVSLAQEQLLQRLANGGERDGPIRLSHLALSGGGEDGGFGAGLLVGWTEHGTRPAFESVTGVSIGAVIAPFAFLGPAYDAPLKELFTTIDSLDAGEPRLLNVLFDTSVLGSAYLADRIERYMDGDMLDAIGRECRRGRRLMLGTTNLDAGRPVVWNICRLATGGRADALPLFRRIVLASTSVPGVFDPVLFDVEAGGKPYDELLVDGGVTAQAFLYPAQVRLAKLLATDRFNQRLYLIRNRKFGPDYQDSIAGLFSILERSVRTLIRSQGNGDTYQLYLLTLRDGIDYNLAFIPESFAQTATSIFDGDYIRSLFELGYDLGRQGYPWSKGPPGFDKGDMAP